MSLKTKVISFLLTLGLFSGGLIIELAWRSVGSIVTKNLVTTGLKEITELADTSVAGLQIQSETLLLSSLQNAQHSSGADYVAALDPEGRVLAHTNVSEKGTVYRDPLTLEILQDIHQGTRVIKRGEDSVLEVWSPVWMKQNEESNEQFLLGGQAVPVATRRLGTVRLSLPMRGTFQTQIKIIREMGLIVGLIGSVAFLFTLGLLRKILIPIRLLAQGTARIANGQYGIEVPVTSKDELGILANSFNRMSKVLADTTVSKDFLGDILSNMIDPLIVVAADGTIRMANQATLKMLDYEEKELQGQPAHVLFLDKNRLPSGLEQETLIGKKSVQNLELEFRKKDGAKVPVLFSSSPLQDAEGHFTGIIATAKDMTERKRLEGAIRQSEKMSAVGQLAAGVAHEINNPLGVILGFAQAAVRRLQPNDPLELPLKSIEKEAIRCKDLVQNLLTFSRVSKIEREPMDINRAAEGAFTLVMAQARISHVEVRKEFAANLPRVLGNPNQIQQVIINLTNNALDAMGDNTGVLTLKTESLQEGPLSWVCLRVIDTGPGIPPEIISRIFDPFFTTKPLGKGTGLGLSLVHEIIKKHSGTIDAQSRPGYTEFCVKLPIRLAPESVQTKHATTNLT
jgi:PAS domain S-box-containing protein